MTSNPYRAFKQVAMTSLLPAALVGLNMAVPQALAATPKAYVVDIIVMTPNTQSWVKEEVFPTALGPKWSWWNDAYQRPNAEPKNGQPAGARFEIVDSEQAPYTPNLDDAAAKSRTAITPLTGAALLSQHTGRVEQRLLQTEQKRLERSGQYRVLFQTTFVQEFKPLEESTQYWLESDSRVKGQPELGGWITFYKGRFLHVKADMLLTKAGWDAAPVKDVAKDKAAQKAQDTDASEKDETAQSVPEAAKPTYWVKRIPVEHRQKLKSGKIYYLDHPGLGILIKLSPINT